MKTKVVLLLVLALGVISFTLDKRVAAAFSLSHNPFLSYAAELTGSVSLFAVALLAAASLFIWTGKRKRWIKVLWLGIIASAITSTLMKLVVARPRPELAGLILTEYSFPSGHATLVFSLLPVLSREFPRLKLAWLLFALLVAFSRLYLGVHYFSDVVWGAIIGYLIGKCIVMLQEAKKLDWLAWKKLFH